MAEHGEPVELVADGRPVPITNPNKVLFPKLGLTKLDLANYYLAVGDPLMGWIRDRPVLLERYPNGVGGKSFFQKRIPESAPDWLSTTTVQTINGTPSRALVIADLAHVLWAANQGVLGLHVWQYTADKPQWSDELRIDLDPSPGQTFDHIREAAMYVRLYFADLGIRSYVKTTGSKGLHIYVRVVDGYDSFAVRGCVDHGRPRSRPAAPRSDHRRVVEGAARREGVRRLQPECTAQERVRRLGRAATSRCPGVDTVRVGRADGRGA